MTKAFITCPINERDLIKLINFLIDSLLGSLLLKWCLIIIFIKTTKEEEEEEEEEEEAKIKT